MPTKKEMIATIRKLMEAYDDGFAVLHEDAERDLLVVRVPGRNGGFEYVSSTHWSVEGALTLLCRNPGDVPDPVWSAGGTAHDATPMDVANVMRRVWEDAHHLILGATADADPADGATVRP